MKQLTTIFMAVFIFSNNLTAQFIKDKQAFAKTFIKIFEQRETAFDSLRAKDWEDSYASTVKMPGATECYISDNLIYGALYRGTDSLKMLGFYHEMKQLLAYVASFYKAIVKFKTYYANNPYYEQFFFSDSSLFTSEGSNISFSKSYNADRNNDDDDYEDLKKNTSSKDSFEVLLLIWPGNSISYYTSAGEKLHDPEVKQIISQIAFGNDPWLNGIKINKRIQKDANYYDSKLNVKGFTTVIREASNAKKSYVSATLTKIYNTNEESFMRSGDSLALKIKTAMPPGYCYTMTQVEEGINIEFKPIPFLKEIKNAPEINLNYSKVANKKNSYQLELVIERTISK